MLSQEFILDEQRFKLLEHRNTKLLTLLLEAGADVKLLQVLVVAKHLCNWQLRIRTTDLKYLRFSLVRAHLSILPPNTKDMQLFTRQWRTLMLR